MVWAILAVIVLVGLIGFGYLVSLYNGLVKLRNAVKNAWAQIDVQLKRRHDLIPNLVETVKGFKDHEKGTFEAITNARASAMKARESGDVKKISQAESKLQGAMSQFMLTVEAYPDLKSNQNFLALQEELTSTENKIAFSRQAYNDQVLFFNNKVEMFPSNIVAGIFQFSKADFFEIEDEKEKEVPKISF